MNQYLAEIALVRPSFPLDGTDDEKELVMAHFARLVGDQRSGKVFLAGRTLTASPRGLVIFQAEDDDAARRYMEEDPAVTGGVMRIISIEPYAVAVYPGLND